ncbi:16S rRNA (uracil(1498)-N(3))-methyltransferase [Robertmurraya korlensis]|uniref:16S rRNA (uracil(1498)-N(3))-methyltransferase n=1 Tax=Robertmurraya korlensis TaxID=519977 RepID=UPI0008243E1A|nr:16S rRNA (uracil(1498)-N(3))-methyltransferase [Robertmurraya korlensis]
MQRYFVDQTTEGRFVITGDDFRHIVKVMRLKISDQIICTTSRGEGAICQIAEITDEQVVADVVQWEERSSELPVRVTIASGLPKADKLEWIIQKGTELGAYSFVPVATARSVVKWDEKKAEKKVDRWQKIAKEAAEQSHRRIVPSVATPVNLSGLISLSKDYTYKLVAYEEEAKQGERSTLARTLQGMKNEDSVLIVFGPEGGLTESEVELLSKEGFESCGLGPRILRTETAPLYVLSVISYQFELLR